MAGVGIGVAAGHSMFGSIGRAAASGPDVISGSDLSGWEVAVGDGLWLGAGESPVTLDDLDTVHHGTHSELIANVHERGVMAHNITFRRRSALGELDLLHSAQVEFRLPDLPTTSNWSYNAQTLELGLFVWDGPAARLDHGLAVQWVINPWVPEFGALRTWTMTESGPVWQPIGALTPDTEWHQAEVRYRPSTNNATLRIDSTPIPIDETFTTKHDDWGNTIDGRFQVELVSVWPGANASVPAHRAEFRNWSWATSPS